MQKKPRTPSQIASERQTKQKYSFSLIKKNVQRIQEMAAAANIPVSEIIDEAIISYLANLNTNGSNSNK
jgi:hypothetical protein